MYLRRRILPILNPTPLPFTFKEIGFSKLPVCITNCAVSQQDPTEMAVADLVTDPALCPLVSSSTTTLTHILEMLSWVGQNQTTEPSLEVQLTLSTYQKKLIAHLAQLRGHNRRAIFGVRATKQETAEARQEVDRLLLQLQNLYYEQRHLMGEIGACEGYEYEPVSKLPLHLVNHSLTIL